VAYPHDLQFCPERKRLLQALLIATTEFTKIGKMIFDRVGKEMEWKPDLEATASAARTNVEKAKQALELHKWQHGCVLRKANQAPRLGYAPVDRFADHERGSSIT
jgi:hypothetical protein